MAKYKIFVESIEHDGAEPSRGWVDLTKELHEIDNDLNLIKNSNYSDFNGFRIIDSVGFGGMKFAKDESISDIVNLAYIFEDYDQLYSESMIREVIEHYNGRLGSCVLINRALSNELGVYETEEQAKTDINNMSLSCNNTPLYFGCIERNKIYVFLEIR